MPLIRGNARINVHDFMVKVELVEGVGGGRRSISSNAIKDFISKSSGDNYVEDVGYDVDEGVKKGGE